MARTYGLQMGSGSGTPSSRNAGSFTKTVTVAYQNGQTENINVLFKVKPNKPVIDSNSVISKGQLNGQQILVRNVPQNASHSISIKWNCYS